ncbi:efflux RND transporter periplasmic adaptor subunit [Salidesulfovibrio onnuriiensis]|uniref:efflux RND transporter periplasmic adaptor subunit n=1 Tax=Salidesulfovibrio onnuriiensis TaxID=2583823 RepID=UPI00202B76C7|nr:HlyD family efflux transporter periplasmic adaptor subunit [Salidesulfovibrio onnuriiensis]
MKRILVFMLAAGVLLFAGCGNGDKEAGAQESPKPEAAVSGESVASVEKRPETPASTETFMVRPAARNATLTAFTRARNSMTLVSEVSARVERVPTDVGDVIGADGVFAYLDATFIQLDLDKNRADQQRLRSDVVYFGKEKGRYDELVKQKTAAQSTLDSFARDHTTSLQQLKALQIEEKRLMEQLDRHTLRAPAGWKVTERYIEPGEWVNVGDKVAELGRYDVLLVPLPWVAENTAPSRTWVRTCPCCCPNWA